MADEVGGHQGTTCVVVGAGNRGRVYAEFAKHFPERLRVVAVCEPNQLRRDRMCRAHGLDPTADSFASWEPLVEEGVERLADFAVVATQDKDHAAPAIALASRGYHILLEKPMATTPEDCRAIATACEEAGIMLCVCHVLRYAPANRKIKELIDGGKANIIANESMVFACKWSECALVWKGNEYPNATVYGQQSGSIGSVININHTEPVGFYHFAHSFVRGNWRSEAESAPALLAKSCHDIDLLRYWMSPATCTAVSSFGSLRHFTATNRPKGAAERCLECEMDAACPYSARKIYLDRAAAGHTGWPVSVITDIPDIESVAEALRTGPYGRCVYGGCDNDVVDNQIVALEFGAAGATATFSMIAFSEKLCVRQTTIYGSHGQLSVTDDRHVRHFDFATQTETIYDTLAGCDPSVMRGHGGSDFFLMDSWVRAVATGDVTLVSTSARDALASHLLVFEAEAARHDRVVRPL